MTAEHAAQVDERAKATVAGVLGSEGIAFPLTLSTQILAALTAEGLHLTDVPPLPPMHLRDDTGRVWRVEHDHNLVPDDPTDPFGLRPLPPVPLYRLVPVDPEGTP